MRSKRYASGYLGDISKLGVVGVLAQLSVIAGHHLDYKEDGECYCLDEITLIDDDISLESHHVGSILHARNATV